MFIKKNKSEIKNIKLKQLITINPENIDSKIDEIDYIDISSTKDGFINDIKNIKGKKNFPSRAKRKTKKNDIIYSTVRPNLNGYAMLREDNKTVSTGFAVIRCLDFWESIFVYHFLKSDRIKNKIINFCEGGNYPAFKANNLNSLNVATSLKEDRKKIAIFLYNQENHINNIKSLIEKLELRNQEMAERLLSGELRVRLDDNGKIEFYKNPEDNWQKVKLNGKMKKIPTDWDIDLLKNIIKLKKGTSISSAELNHDGNGIQYLRTNEIWETSAKTKEPVFFDGDLDKIETKDFNDWVVCFDGYNRKPNEGTLGMVTNSGYGILSGELFKIKPKKSISELFVNVNLLRSFYFQELICRYGEGSTVKHAGKHVKNIWLQKIPIFEQKLLNNIFASQIEEVNKLKKLLKNENIRFEQMSEMLLSGEYVLED